MEKRVLMNSSQGTDCKTSMVEVNYSFMLIFATLHLLKSFKQMRLHLLFNTLLNTTAVVFTYKHVCDLFSLLQ